MSHTTSVGLVSVSENTRRVLSRTAALSSSSVASGETKVHSMPKRLSVTANRFTVPPYTPAVQMKWSPALQMFRIDSSEAA